MPFKSEKQRRYLWMHEPEVAKKWAHEAKRKRRKKKRKKKKKRKSRYKGKKK